MFRHRRNRTGHLTYVSQSDLEMFLQCVDIYIRDVITSERDLNESVALVALLPLLTLRSLDQRPEAWVLRAFTLMLWSFAYGAGGLSATWTVRFCFPS